VVTAGGLGLWCSNGRAGRRLPAIPVQVWEVYRLAGPDLSLTLRPGFHSDILATQRACEVACVEGWDDAPKWMVDNCVLVL